MEKVLFRPFTFALSVLTPRPPIKITATATTTRFSDIEREGMGVTETVAIVGIVGTVMLGVGMGLGALMGQGRK
jgi:hypothetical protein